MHQLGITRWLTWKAPVHSHLRQLNPSPYMFYIECGNGTQLVGASPECLCKVEEGGKVTNHAIAGTVRRGKTAEGASTFPRAPFSSDLDESRVRM